MAANCDVFFAYASTSSLRGEVIADVAKRLRTSGFSAKTWKDLRIEGDLLINTITEAIDAADAFCADVSVLNFNVLFELGYAMARNKRIWIILDESDRDALKAWGDLALLETVGRIDYTGNTNVLFSKLSSLLADDSRRLQETLLAGAKPRESNAIFAPSLPIGLQAASVLESFLERQSHLKLLAAEEDLGLAPLQFYAQSIYRSSAAIFHLLGPTRLRAEEHNSRASLLAGYAHGLELPTLMVAESAFVTPLDYRDMLFRYDTAARLQTHASEWLASLPKDSSSRRRMGRLALDVELPIRSFGEYVAEYERQELGDYFVDTNEFRAILSNTSKVFIGRKGTGKTATMTQAVEELRRDRRNLVVPVKPSSYELSGLLQVMDKVANPANVDYFLTHLWTYLIYSEMAIRALKHAADMPAGVGGSPELLALQENLDNLGVDIEMDMSGRLEGLVTQADQSSRDQDVVDKEAIASLLRVKQVAILGGKLRDALYGYDRVAVVMDNLDKAWQRGADYKLLSQLLLNLLHTGGRIEDEFQKSSRGRAPVNASLSIFLRTDIYEVMLQHARERDKVGGLSVQWQDRELLVRVLEERFAANGSGKKSRSIDMWGDLFCDEVRGIPTRDYFLWRSLPRPRDLIYFANQSLTAAVNRRHSRIEAVDITLGLTQYSRFALDALLVESEARAWDLEEVLYEFAGMDATVGAEDLDAMLSKFQQREDIKSWLVRTAFLGVETGDGDFEHVEGHEAARRKMRVAERLSQRLGREQRFRVHPAFRHALDVTDDDLHVTGIRDVTLN